MWEVRTWGTPNFPNAKWSGHNKNKKLVNVTELKKMLI